MTPAIATPTPTIAASDTMASLFCESQCHAPESQLRHIAGNDRTSGAWANLCEGQEPLKRERGLRVQAGALSRRCGLTTDRVEEIGLRR